MVVYDCASGDTHCLDTLLTAAFETLAAEGEVTAGSLGAALRQKLGPCADSDEWRGGVALAELERLKLARQN